MKSSSTSPLGSAFSMALGTKGIHEGMLRSAKGTRELKQSYALYKEASKNTTSGYKKGIIATIWSV